MGCFCGSDLYPRPLPSPGYPASEKERVCCLCVCVSVRWTVCSWRRSSSCCAPPQERPLPQVQALREACGRHLYVPSCGGWGQNQNQHPAPAWECSCIHRLAPGANPPAGSGAQSSAQKSSRPRSARQLVTQEMVPHLGGSLEPPWGPSPGLPVLM